VAAPGRVSALTDVPPATLTGRGGRTPGVRHWQNALVTSPVGP